ncbi:hypothetical protein KUTeg_021431 [Tegillarca granosa]|uniref:Transcriptional coactivator p15 (PC4) C-terminal domain-containing protein n=1 Tax=Tegillarca granosa TaxID=220873 RepID=A0ABQ9E7Q7_TEGGR|nr:hypothetical protein KUTeg_021431 [Tegillarca granosa]
MANYGDEQYVVVEPFKGELKVHIRQYEKGINGLFPTNRGIVLHLEKWKKLEELYSEKADQSVTRFHNAGEEVNFMQHLGTVEPRKGCYENDQAIIDKRTGGDRIL